MSSDVNEMSQVMRDLWDKAFLAGRIYEAELMIEKVKEFKEQVTLIFDQRGGMH